MTVAYLTNQYPKVSHTFIRREIRELEARGFSIARFSIRGTPDALRDPEDLAEQERTTVLMHLNKLALLGTLSRVAILRPFRFGRAAVQAWKLGAVSERGHAVNLAYLLWAANLLKLTEDAGCKHLHVHFGTNPAAVALLCHTLGGPSYSFTVHGPEEFDKPHSISLREKIEGSKFVAAVSSFGRSQLFRHCDQDQWSKVQIVRCGIDETFVGPPPNRARQRDKLVCVGRICEQKGQLLLIQAVADLLRRGIRAEVVLVGDGELRSAAERMIARLGVKELITITGWQSSEQVREHLLGARAMVLPSFAEGLPVVIMEAMALECPVVSTYIAGIPELVQDGVSGWLVPAGSVEALAEVMARVLSAEQSDLERMGAEGRRKVVALHAIGEAVKPLIEAFG